MSSQIFDYDDINLIPKKCIVNSRLECDTSVIFGIHRFKLPIVPANMECVIDVKLAEELAKQGYFYVMHRFNINTVEFIKYMKSLKLITSISIGVNEDSYDLIRDLVKKDLIPDYITIDIAHGHSIKMKNMLSFISGFNELDKTYIIAGNISTIEAAIDIEKWGANCCKVGIGPGMACTTYHNTGFGSRGMQASTIETIAKYLKDKEITLDIIADGGIRHVSDIAKSIVLGAKMVMVGGMLTGFKESPGKIIQGTDGKMYQEFYGSASEFSVRADGTKNKNIEGVSKLLPYKNQSIFTYYEHITQCLQSSISYGGGNDLLDLRDVEYHIVRK